VLNYGTDEMVQLQLVTFSQLAFAVAMSILYSVLMTLVLFSLVKQSIDNSFCSVTTVFTCFLAGVFIIAGIVHPQVRTLLKVYIRL